MMKARESGEGLRGHADGLMEYATELALADAEVGGYGFHARAGQLLGGLERERRMGVAGINASEAFGDRCFEDCRGTGFGARGRELVEEPLCQGVAP